MASKTYTGGSDGHGNMTPSLDNSPTTPAPLQGGVSVNATSTGEAGPESVKAQIILNGTKVQKVTANNSVCCFTGVTVKEKSSVTKCTFSSNDSKWQDIEFEKSLVGIVKGETKQLTSTNSDVNISHAEIQDKASFQDGSLQSAHNQYKKLTAENVTIDSFDDQADECSFTKLVGPSVIRNLEASGDLTLSGDGKSSLLIEKSKSSTVDAKDFGKLEMYDDEFKTVTAKDVGFLICLYSDIQNMTLKDVITAITDPIENMNASNCTVIDSGSKITCDDCTIMTSGSDGKVTASKDCVVIVQGGTEIINPDGLTMGSKFDLQKVVGPCVQSDGVIMNIQNTADINIHALTEGDINITTDVKNINVTAAVGNINVSATLGDINIDAAVGKVDIFGTQSINLTSIGPINLEGSSINNKTL